MTHGVLSILIVLTVFQVASPADGNFGATPAASESTEYVATFQGNSGHTGEMPGPGPDPEGAIRTRWEFATDRAVTAAPVVSAGRNYVGGMNRMFYALNLSTGEAEWGVPMSSAIRETATVVDGIVYTSGTEGTLNALDASTGATVWTSAVGSGAVTSPAVVDGRVYVGSADRTIVRVDAETGEGVWRTPTSAGVSSSPAVQNGVLYAADDGGTIYALDMLSGDVLWRIPTGSSLPAELVVHQGFVYAGSGNGTLYAFDTETQEEVWRFSAGTSMNASPVVVDDSLYIGTASGDVHALDALSGTQHWIASVGSMLSPASYAGGVLYIGTQNKEMLALDSETGSTIWRIPMSSAVTSSPLVIDGMVVFGSANGLVTALESVTPYMRWHSDCILSSNNTLLYYEERTHIMTKYDSRAGNRVDPSKSDGDYTPAGEDQGQSRSFSADEVAAAFGVQVDRVHNAYQGEFQLGTDATVDSKQAQHLAEVILGDQPLDQQQAALMKLGAYTPRTDAAEATATEKRPGEQSDRIRPSEQVPEVSAPREDGE